MAMQPRPSEQEPKKTLMKKIIVLAISSTLMACVNAVSPSAVNKISSDTYEISRVGGWGYDLNDLKLEVKNSAETFARSAGKQMVVISEEVKPDETVGTYPAYDDTYTLRFRLVDKN
jgi:hypothetical protein